jgi:hypothetical protein
MSEHPPKPRLALAIGVVGHRPNRLPADGTKLDKITQAIGNVLDAIAGEAATARARYSEFFSDEMPLVSVVSALAEGADRMTALAVVARNEAMQRSQKPDAEFVLDVPLPFAATTYADDFKADESKAEFAALQKQARSVLALPGERALPDDSEEQARLRESKSYEAVGLTVLNQSDILLAVWDGERAAGRGGTTDMLNFSVSSGIPIIHVDAKGEAATSIRWNGLSEFPVSSNAFEDLPSAGVEAALPRLFDELIRPPVESAGGHNKKTHWPRPSTERDWLKRYLHDRVPCWNLRVEFPVLMAMFGVRRMHRADWRPPGPGALSAEFVQLDKSPVELGRLQEQSVLALAYGWADAFAAWFGQVFRSAFVTNFLLAAFAVLAAALSLVWTDPGKLDATTLAELAHHKVPFVVFELICILAVLVNTASGRWHGWHRRWFEAREVAERLRAALPLWVLGVRPVTFAGEEPAWTGWYARAIIRAQGMRAGTLDVSALNASRATLDAVLRHQCDYHRSSAGRMSNMERRLEWVGVILFVFTLITAGLFVAAIYAGVTLTPRVAYLVTAVAAGLPALATATYGIRVIGDFEGSARRSERTHLALENVIEAIRRDRLDLALLRARARSAADIMLGDVSSWRLAAESRTLAIPG